MVTWYAVAGQEDQVVVEGNAAGGGAGNTPPVSPPQGNQVEMEHPGRYNWDGGGGGGAGTVVEVSPVKGQEEKGLQAILMVQQLKLWTPGPVAGTRYFAGRWRQDHQERWSSCATGGGGGARAICMVQLIQVVVVEQVIAQVQDCRWIRYSNNKIQISIG